MPVPALTARLRSGVARRSPGPARCALLLRARLLPRNAKRFRSPTIGHHGSQHAVIDHVSDLKL
jgi:hypothetical protein